MKYVLEVQDKVKLQDLDSKQDGGFAQDDGKKETERLGIELEELQGLMFAAGTHSLLIVLQGRDTAGKDGSVRGLSRYLNIQGVQVKGFKVPTPEELAHDFLWRVHPAVPAKGMISIFNRSHYEDVIVVRVHKFVPEEVWKKRFDEINEFEQLLVENNTIIAKFCLNISNDEQAARLTEREQSPLTSWKLSVNDWKEREFWNEYTVAYNDALSKCSPKNARWMVVPADRKWFRDLAITNALVEILRPYRSGWEKKLKDTSKVAEAALAEYRATLKKA